MIRQSIVNQNRNVSGSYNIKRSRFRPAQHLQLITTHKLFTNKHTAVSGTTHHSKVIIQIKIIKINITAKKCLSIISIVASL